MEAEENKFFSACLSFLVMVIVLEEIVIFKDMRERNVFTICWLKSWEIPVLFSLTSSANSTLL